MAENKIFTRDSRMYCKRLSKCGKHSFYYCRKNRETDDECIHCKWIRRHHRHATKMENGVKLRKCPTCERFLPLHRFYPKKAYYKDKIYRTLSSSCKMCTSAKEAEKIRNRKRKALESSYE